MSDCQDDFSPFSYTFRSEFTDSAFCKSLEVRVSAAANGKREIPAKVTYIRTH